MNQFSASDAALEGFRLTRERPGAILAWAGVYFVGIVVMGIMMMASLGPQFIEIAKKGRFTAEDTEAVDTDELLRRLGDGDTLVLDVRPGSEYAAGHLPGAVTIPLEHLADRLAELPRDLEVVACCRGQSCVLAHDAVRLLTGAGLRAKRATDGILEWRVAGVSVQMGAA